MYSFDVCTRMHETFWPEQKARVFCFEEQSLSHQIDTDILTCSRGLV